ncbi:MAG: hypothetical protein V7720_18695, partial [Halioglobus sp.]
EMDYMSSDQVENVLNTMQEIAREEQSTQALMNDLEPIDQRLASQEKACNTSGSRGTIPLPTPAPGLLVRVLRKISHLFKVRSSD